MNANAETCGAWITCSGDMQLGHTQESVKVEAQARKLWCLFFDFHLNFNLMRLLFSNFKYKALDKHTHTHPSLYGELFS